MRVLWRNTIGTFVKAARESQTCVSCGVTVKVNISAARVWIKSIPVKGFVFRGGAADTAAADHAL